MTNNRKENPMIDLRPCPFCKSTEQYMDSQLMDEVRWHFVVCRDCWAEGPACCETHHGGEAAAVELARQAWNGDISAADGMVR